MKVQAAGRTENNSLHQRKKEKRFSKSIFSPSDNQAVKYHVEGWMKN